MPDYKKMYFSLMNAVTTAKEQLQNAQLAAEKAYIEDEPVALSLPRQAEEQTF
ncbi:MAG: hypothetical protein GX572_03180 [Clostridia bacterium]|nr:hypothetical protein [Clostridia bacterium]